MSGLPTPTAVCDRTAIALAEWARTNGRTYDEAAAILGIGHGPAWQRVQGAVGWTLRDFARAACHAERIDGDRSMLDQFVADVRGPTPVGEAVLAVPAAVAVAAQAGGLIRDLMDRLKDGRIDRLEASATRFEIPRLRAALDELDRHCERIESAP